MSELYRKGVGIMLVNKYNQAFVGQRKDFKDIAWQMPQGGVDDGEEPIQAAFRELKEEIGTNNAELIAQSSKWVSYDLPTEIASTVWQGKYKGQKHMWFLFRFLGDDSEINIATAEPEFIAWKWCPHTELIANIVDFKKELYKHVLKQFESYLK